MYDYSPATGEGAQIFMGEQTPDRLRGWRIDGQDGHVNWWDWTGGKKGAGAFTVMTGSPRIRLSRDRATSAGLRGKMTTETYAEGN